MNAERTVANDNVISTIKKVGIDGTTLKWIALIAMVIDHVGAVFFVPETTTYFVLRAIGRLSFPIFAFLITQGYVHTGNWKKYALRLLLFAFVSEIPYDLAFYNSVFSIKKQNIFFTLLLGLLVIRLKDYITNDLKMPKWAVENDMVVLVQSGIQLFVIITLCLLAYKANLCYSYPGILLIALFHAMRGRMDGIVWPNVIFSFMFGKIQLFGMAAIIPLSLYNGKPGNRKYKWLFYIYYPVHLVLFWMIHKYL
ncbi:MAG: conjugal transfer protein TraX [Lachnospiraceae bacterium]|nr:conjugal transfer protein TraX [Lachnospiraceae bacterium]